MNRYEQIVAVDIDILAKVPAFDRLVPLTLERLAQEATVVNRQPQEAFYLQDDPPAGLFALISGRVKLFRRSQERTQILAILMPGECFGAETLPEDASSPYAATALTPATAAYIPPEVLRALLIDCPELRVVLVELVSGRLRQFVSLVHNLAFRDVAARLATVLLALAETDGEPFDDGIRVDSLLSQQELAAMVGTAREVVYRTFKKFERDGIVRRTRKHIFILDSDRLGDISRQESR